MRTAFRLTLIASCIWLLCNLAFAEHRLEQREEESREAQARRRRKRAARRIAVAQ